MVIGDHCGPLGPSGDAGGARWRDPPSPRRVGQAPVRRPLPPFSHPAPGERRVVQMGVPPTPAPPDRPPHRFTPPHIRYTADSKSQYVNPFRCEIRKPHSARRRRRKILDGRFSIAILLEILRFVPRFSRYIQLQGARSSKVVVCGA